MQFAVKMYFSCKQPCISRQLVRNAPAHINPAYLSQNCELVIAATSELHFDSKTGCLHTTKKLIFQLAKKILIVSKTQHLHRIISQSTQKQTVKTLEFPLHIIQSRIPDWVGSGSFILADWRLRLGCIRILPR